MHSLIDAIAWVTRSHDRDVLDSSLVVVLARLLSPRSVRLYKRVPVANREAVHCRLEYAGETLHERPLPLRSERLPGCEAFPWALRWFSDAVHSATDRLQINESLWRFALHDGRICCGWIEIDGVDEPAAQNVSLVSALLRIYANHLAMIHYAEHDSLTGLLNRKTFNSAFQGCLTAPLPESTPPESTPPASAPSQAGEQGRAESDPDGFWLGLVDIDWFKRINDQFGHLYGDEVLVLLARLMRDSFRLSDRLFRMGGEEFAVLLDRTAGERVAEVLNRFRQTVGAYSFPQVGVVTVSIGFCPILPTDLPAQAYERADAALYLAKQGGRDRVCGWQTRPSPESDRRPVMHEDVELFS